jgi:hypothetical protein
MVKREDNKYSYLRQNKGEEVLRVGERYGFGQREGRMSGRN